MRRAGYYKKKAIDPDSKYGRVDFARFINYLMLDGKKGTAEKVFYNTLDLIEKKTKSDPLEVFDKAINNASPIMEVVSRRVGGANYQIPREVRTERKYFLATQWLIEAARSKKGSPLHERLAEELIAASNNEGAAIKKREQTHRMAEANKAFASFLR